jgi:hypothetical protein
MGMSHPLVVHCKKEKYDVYCGRPSRWGNPFEVGKDGTRKEVIEKFEKWLAHNSELLKDIGELKGKILGCWCAPLPCHCEILAELANRE